MQMEDRILVSDLLEDVRQQCIRYNEMALEASDDELKKSFLGFHDAEMRLHTMVYNYMKNHGWYAQQAGDLTASGGFRGNFWPHGRGEKIPLDQPDQAYGKSTWEAHNGPRYEGHHYKQDHERNIRNEVPSHQPWNEDRRGGHDVRGFQRENDFRTNVSHPHQTGASYPQQSGASYGTAFQDNRSFVQHPNMNR